MTEPITLPPLPRHPEPHTYVWTKLELEEIRAYGHRCFQAGSKQSEVAALPVEPDAAPEGYKLACIGDSPSAPYPGMIAAFERHYGQSFADKDWRDEASVWAAAWKASKARSAAQEPTK